MIQTNVVPMGLTQDQFNAWWDRYALRDEKGNQVESIPDDTFDRVASAIAQDQTEASDFYRVLSEFKLVPGGRILASAGAANETMAYNCFVIPVRADAHRDSGADSRDAIMDTINTMVQIMSRGGGVGINWSTLRPRGSHLSRVNGTSSGSVGWMDVASSAVGEVIQGGSRRGAAMFMLWDWHPDILEFTDAKRDQTKITNANISVAISDSFMEAVKNDGPWTLKFPDTTHPRYNTEWDGDIRGWEQQGLPVIEYATMPARDLWTRICAGAWDNGEPGVVFLERYNNLSTARDIEKIIGVNPCGEQGLGAFSVCNLASMNLVKYVKTRTAPMTFVTPEIYFDTDEFAADVRVAVRFLDNVIDKTFYIEDLPEIREQQMKLRRIGLGVMGLADVFAMMKVRYGDPASVQLTESIFKTMKEAALRESASLAEKYGPAGGWNINMLDEAPYLQDIDDGLIEQIDKHGLRNLFLLTQAPTGTTSMFAGVNSGIEPFFALEYERSDRLGKRMVRPAPVQQWLERQDTTKGAYDDLPLHKMDVPDYFVTADQLTVEEHVAIQAAAQKYIDSSISKTVNAPNSHTVEDVDRLYMLCYDSGLKGVSYFREGCNRAVVLSRTSTEEKNESRSESNASPYVRPERVYGVTQRKRTKHGHAFVTVNYAEDNGPIEAFIQVGRASSDLAEWAEGYGRLISLLLRHGISKEEVAEQLTGVGGYSKMQPSLSTSVAEALKDASMGTVPTETSLPEAPVPVSVPASTGAFTPEICTQCGSAAFIRAEGCMTCQVCGNSKC